MLSFVCDLGGGHLSARVHSGSVHWVGDGLDAVRYDSP